MNPGPIDTGEVGSDLEGGEVRVCCLWLHVKAFRVGICRSRRAQGSQKDFAAGRLCKRVLSRIIPMRAERLKVSG